MNYLERNKSILESHHEGIFTKLFEEERSVENTYEVTSYATLSNEKMVVITEGENAVRLNSLYDPSHEAKRFVKHINFKNTSATILLFGLGNGIIVRELLAHLNSSMHLIVYEPSVEVLEHTMGEYVMEDILTNEQLTLVIKGLNDENFKGLLMEQIGYMNLDTAIYVTHPNYLPLFQEAYSSYKNDISWFTSFTRSAKSTLGLLGKEGVENAIYNLKSVGTSANIVELRNTLDKDIPAIIVSAGPSLDKNMNELKHAKGKSVIIAVDRAVNTLLDHGIIPDFSVTMDAKKPVEFYSRKESREIPLFYVLSARKEIVSGHEGVKVLVNVDKYFNQFIDEIFPGIGVTLAGGSVATIAFTIAMELGAKKLILVGQDLAFANGRTHASGAAAVQNQEDVLLVPGMLEPYVETIPNLYMYSLWFEEMAKNLPEEYLAIDATEGGTLKQGFKIMTLADAIDEYCKEEFDFTKVLENAIDKNYENEKKVLELTQKSIEDLDTIRKYANEGRRICLDAITELKQKGTNKKYLQNAEKLDQYDAFIQTSLVYGFIDMYTAYYTLDEVKDIYIYEEDEKQYHINVLTKTYNIYQQIEETARTLGGHFQELYKNIV